MRSATGQQAVVSTGETASKRAAGRRARRLARRQAQRKWVAITGAVGGLTVTWASMAHATDHLWNASTGDYNVAGNWNPTTVPGSGDNAIVSNGGVVLITAADPAWTAFDVRAGDNADGVTGNGTYIQTGSTVTANSWFRLGADTAGVTGTYNMSAGVFVGHGNVRIGETGTGYLNLSGTANFSADGSMNGTYWAVGANPGSVGYMNVAGSAVVNDTAGSDRAPIQVAASTGATGTLTLSDSATINTNSNELWVGQNGTGTFNQSGGTLNVGNWIAVGRQGGTGVWNLTGGVVNKTGGGDISISGDGASELGIVNQAGGVLNNTASDTYIGDGSVGAWNLSGGTANFSETDLGRNGGAAGTVNLTGGVMNAAVANGQFAVGYAAGSTGVLNVTAGTLNVGTAASNTTGLLAIGQAGTGTLSLSGTGAINALGGVSVGSNTGAVGTVNMTAGTLTAGGTANPTAYLAVGDSGTGTFNLSGGTVTAPNVYAGRTASATGTINVTAGTLNASTVSIANEDVGGATGASGTVTLSGTGVINATSVVVAKSSTGTGTFTMTGGTLNTAQFERGSGTTAVVNLNGGTLTNSTGTDNPSFITGFHAGELNVNGVTINTGSNTLGITSPLSGSGFVKAGSGVLTINGSNSPSANTGTTTISAGTIRLAAPSAVLPTANVVGFYPMTTVLASNSNGATYVVPDMDPAHTAANANDLTVAGGTVTATTTAPPGTTGAHAGSLSYSNGGFLTYAYGGQPVGLPVGNSAYTIGAWVNLSTANNNGSGGSTGNNGVDGIVGYGNYGPTGQTNAFRTGYYSGGANGVTNYWEGDDGSAPLVNASSGATTLGNWHYIAVTYDPTAGGVNGGGLGVRTIYDDGQVIDSEDPNQQHNTALNNFTVGVTNLLASPSEFFSGNMADLIITSSALTAPQLAVAASSDNPFAVNNSGGAMSITSSMNIASGATFDLNGNNQTLAGVTGTGAVTLGAGTLTVNNAAADLFSGTISGTGGLTKSGVGTLTLGGTGSNLTYTGLTTVNAGTLTFAANAATTPLVRSFSGGILINGGTLALPTSNTSGGRTLLSTASLTFATNASTGAIVGKLDLGNGDLDVKNTSATTAAASLSAITAAAASGYAGGTWTGNGLTSASAAADSLHLTAVGVILNATSMGTPIYTSFDGTAVAATDVLARYTYYGDTNLDGVVNAGDYTRIDAGFLGKLTGWVNGDFNYDGIVDGSDYTLMDNAFNQQNGMFAAPAAVVASADLASGGIASAADLVASPTALLAGGSASSVPEPTTLGVLAVGAAGLLGRRRRRIAVGTT